jgi:hypothetical protein
MEARGWRGMRLLAVLYCFVLGIFEISRPDFSQQAPAPDRLTRLLQGAKAYCGRLEKAVLDFVCLEEIKEVTRNSEADALGESISSYDNRPFIRGNIYIPRFLVRSWVFDYQYVRHDKFFLEKRTLIEENEKKKKQENAPLPLMAARVKNALFGPIGYLGNESQHQFDFRIVGHEDIEGKPAAIIDGTPKPGIEKPNPFGRVWIREADSSILKIEWDPRSITNIERVNLIAEMLQAEAKLTAFTEYGFEKNGIRFPSRDVTEEGYIKSNGKKMIRSLTTITYKDYKFFTVEVVYQ